jgi:hypothetical protein
LFGTKGRSNPTCSWRIGMYDGPWLKKEKISMLKDD